jgi:hypothetical protein
MPKGGSYYLFHGRVPQKFRYNPDHEKKTPGQFVRNAGTMEQHVIRIELKERWKSRASIAY